MITLSKIAKLANVSVSTASKAFSGSNEVNKETREMVFNIAKKYGCFKKFYNVKYPKLVIAIIAPEFNSIYYTRYMSFIRKGLEKENCELCVSTTNFSIENERALIEYYYKHADVDGVIIIGSRTDITEHCEIPVVLVNPEISPLHCISVLCDIKPAICESVDYLIEKRVDSIGFIGERLTDKKLELFNQILKEKEITPYVSISDERFEAGGYSAMESFFLRKQVPRAIVCGYDYMAIGAIRCIYDHGLSVPQDIAVMGMDDIPEAKFLNPPLSSISIPTEKLCRIAAEAVIKKINGETTKHRQIVTSEFNLRRSFEII